MSNRYKGAVISATPPTTTGGESGTASGAWTLEQQMQAQAAGLWPSQPPPLFIENVFSTYLYTGTGANQTITNGINLSGKGGLVWVKLRSGAVDHYLTDSARGVGNYFSTNSSRAQNGFGTVTNAVTSFNTDGFSLGADTLLSWVNESASTYASWTFRKQPNFFDVVTWTGDGANRTIAHNLGSIPGCIIVKRTNAIGDWQVYHRSLANTEYLVLNTTAAKATGATRWNSTTPTSTEFSLGTDATVNASGGAYVAYLFAHDAGGFGLTGTDNVISCGSYVGTGAAGLNVTLGYEPQWLMVKSATSSQRWEMFDNMRGLPTGGSSAELVANTTAAERVAFNCFNVTATGFVTGADVLDETNASGQTYIYIAIRRGPMAVPTLGTNVFSPNVATTQILTNTVLPSAGFPVDLMFFRKSDLSYSTYWNSRLLPYSNLQANDTAAEITGYPWSFASMTGVTKVTNDWFTGSATPFVFWQFRRAPSFFDQVCYTGTGVRPLQLNHNLGAVPELMIVKRRNLAGSGSSNWFVYSSATGNTSYLQLNTTAASASSVSAWNNTTPTSTTFTVGDFDDVNGSTGFNYVAYLFASCPGVSKVGSYTGTAAAQTINCGFTAGARFILIKRTDSTGDWYVWDSARGIVAGDDPYVVLNTDAAPVTNTDYVDTTSVGFDITSTAPAGLNASGGSYIFLAIA